MSKYFIVAWKGSQQHTIIVEASSKDEAIKDVVENTPNINYSWKFRAFYVNNQ